MFFKEVNEIDLGETTIANIFIDIFMPMANGLYVKVYLLGYRQACDPRVNPKFDNNSIAKNLNIPLSDVIDAWKFWETKNIIKMHKNEGLNDFDYSIEFMDLKRFYMDNMHVNTPSIKSNSDSIVSVSENPSIRRMFNSINQIVGRYLDPGEKISILDIMNKYNMDPDMIVYAYEYVKDKHGSSRPVKYVESILRSWYDSSLYTPQDVENSFAVKSERYAVYKTIFNELGFYRPASKPEERMMDNWLDKLDIEIILEACSRSKNTSNPSISYINGIIERWTKNNVNSIEDIKALDDEHKRKSESKKVNTSSSTTSSTPVKTRFHNINQTFAKYTPDELEKILQESQKDKFK
ncbi:MAG: DnaD domain protein [Romboutsia sp.]|uniref:DnaD domain protein n=1 Tax=Romboutsia sp. TaxID=1965302 RepID=UPI003F2D1E03